MRFEDFYDKSTVDYFFKVNKEKLGADLIMDYDGRRYTRVMKKYYVDKIKSVQLSDKCERHIELNNAIESDFYLRVYIPKIKLEAKNFSKEKVVILINGMNELNFYNFYDKIGEFFAENGITTILLPTPLNLNRRLNYSGKDSETPTHIAANGNEELFFASFLRTYYELSNLINLVRKISFDPRDNGFYKHVFDNKCSISLLGYSLGGLKSLAYFTYLYKKDEQNVFKTITSCITFNSGPNLYQAKTASLKIKESRWSEILNKVNKQFDQFQKHDVLDFDCELQDLVKYYEYLYFGETKKWDNLQSHFASITTAYLAISAGKDPIVGKHEIQGISPQEPLNQIILAGVDHHPGMDNSDWHLVLPRVQANILTFMEKCTIEYYNLKTIRSNLKKILELNSILEKVLEENEILAIHHIKHIRQTLKGQDLEDFNKYYYHLKAFIPSFDSFLDYFRKKEICLLANLTDILSL